MWPGVRFGAKGLKNKHYYNERATYMRQLAKTAQTEGLRKSCLEAAETYDALARQADEPDANGEE